MIYMNTFEDLADKVRSAADCSDAARIIEDFVTEYGCSIAQKNEFNIANVSVSLPDNVTIEKWAWEKCNMRNEVNLRGLKLKFYSEFLRGAMLMRDWIKGNER